MTNSKKTWIAPELVILVRGKLEEAVLISCKYFGIAGGFEDYDGECLARPICSPTSCKTLAAS
jgi:hypothetical protein